MDREQRAREIVEDAKKTRTYPTRKMWLASLIVSSICLVALVIGYLTKPDADPQARKPTSSDSYGSGIWIGFAIGAVVGSALKVRRPNSN